MPEDNTLRIRVKSKGTVLNSDIGGTSLDLEDRYYGDAYNKCMISLQIYKEYYKNKIKDEEKNTEKKNPEKMRRLKRKYDEVNRLRAQVENFEPMRKMEFRQLNRLDKPQPQGTIQMWLDIFTADARFPEYNLNMATQNKYELRVVIWNIYNIPKSKTKQFVDGFVKVTFENSDWSKDAVTKDTDTHFGSKDGNCVYNYRMKFPFELPGEPRLKVQVFDFNTIGSNEVVGASSILLRPLCRKLAKEGKCETEIVKIYITHPNHPNETRGEVELQLQLVTKEEADSKPVGEAQDEPNENPRLEKPTEGRGLGAFLKGTFLDGWSLPDFGIFALIKYALLMGGAFAAMAGLFVMVKFM